MAARYQILEEIGRGAMGRVYLAHDNVLDRDVALKELVAPEYLSVEEKLDLRERFRLEARAAARLSHPHVLTVHDIISSGDRQFMVMEYLEGKTLREILAEKVLTPEEVLSITPMISDALGYAHSHGIIHRDIKPDNIFALENGNIKVADFGIAKMLKVGDMTQTGVIMGTPNYIAPELVKGMTYDHRVDIFSLGVTLYELLIGRRPFDADSDYAIIFKVASEEPVPLDELRDDLSSELAKTIHRALEKNPDQRYPNMVEFKEDLMAARAELGMDVTKMGEPFNMEKAMHEDLEAAKGLDLEGPVEYESSGGYMFHRDKEWKELIARIYHGGPVEKEPEVVAGDSNATVKLTGLGGQDAMMGGGAAAQPAQRINRDSAQASTQASAEASTQASAEESTRASAAAAGGATTTAGRPLAQRETYYSTTLKPMGGVEPQPQQRMIKDPEAAMRWGGVVIGAGVITIISVLLPWVGEILHPGGTLAGISFLEGMLIAALIALVLGADALLLVGVGDAERWTKAMRILSLLCILLVLVFIGVRVVGGIGYDKAPGIGAVDMLKGIGWGLWLALVSTIATYWACGRTEDAAL
jgi:tRNA A-37 threonylcarbamoyl transferase component Bud32